MYFVVILTYSALLLELFQNRIGAATVISAMGAGKRATHGIDKYLQEKYLDKT